MKIHSPLALRLGIVLLVALEFLQNGMLAFGANHIIRGLHSTPQAFSLAAAVYASVAILLIVKHRWLVDRLGYRDFVLGSLALYILGALGAGFAQNMALFTLARAVQAVGGATFFTAARMQVNRFAPSERLVSIRFFVTGLFLGSIIAPILAAWLLSVADWRWLFWIMLIPACANVIMAIWILPPGLTLPSKRSDPHVLGLVVLAAATFLLQFFLERLPYEVFQHPGHLLWLGGLGVIGVVGFVLHEWHRPRPLVRYRRFVNRRYVIGISVFFFFYLVAASNGYLLPLLLADGLGWSMQSIGLSLAIPCLVCMGLVQVAISLARRFPGPRKFLQASLIVLACYAFGMAMLQAQAQDWQVFLLLVMFGIATTFGMEAAAQTALMGIDPEVFSHAYQTKNIVREMALACGISLATVVLQAGEHLPMIGNGIMASSRAYFWMLGVCALVLLLGVTIDGWVRRRIDRRITQELMLEAATSG